MLDELIDWQEYLKYLKENKELFSSDVYRFISDEKRHCLSGLQTFHDAWVRSISIKEDGEGNRPFNAKVNIGLTLLHQGHGREFIIEYDEVSEYKFDSRRNNENHNDTFHGDLLWHRMLVGENRVAQHVLYFSSESFLKISFKAFTFKEKVL